MFDAEVISWAWLATSVAALCPADMPSRPTLMAGGRRRTAVRVINMMAAPFSVGVG